MFYVYDKRNGKTATFETAVACASHMLAKDLNEHIMFTQIEQDGILSFRTVGINPETAEYNDIVKACSLAQMKTFRKVVEI